VYEEPPATWMKPISKVPWVPARDPLESEWMAVERSVSPEEFRRLREFRDAVQGLGLDNHAACAVVPHSKQAATLLRFLRARAGVKESADMFTEALDWRRDFDLDRKLDDWRSEWLAGTSARVRLLKVYDWMSVLGRDFEDLPVTLVRESQADPAGIVREIGMEPLLLHMLLSIEDAFAHARAKMLATGHYTTGFVEIHDMGNYGLVGGWTSRAFNSIPFFKVQAKVFDLVYPERVRVLFLLRAPRAFAAIWKIFEPWVPQATKNKIRMKGQCAREWVHEVEALVPMEVVPAWLQKDNAELLHEALPWAGAVPDGALAHFECDPDKGI